MARQLRAAEGGLIYHALNRANGRLALFEEASDYDAFLSVLTEAVDRHAMRLLAYCVMPNHFHLIVWPVGDGDLSKFMGWVSLTHTQRWHAHRHSAGSGHVYQGRYKSFPIQSDEHLSVACRYVERNPLRAGLVDRAEYWRWGSLAQHAKSENTTNLPTLTRWPITRPRDWVSRVNKPQSPAEEEALQRSIRRNQPFGSSDWQSVTAQRLGLESTFRDRGRPKKPKSGA